MAKFRTNSRRGWYKFFTSELSEYITAQNDYFDECKAQGKKEVPLIPCTNDIKDKLIHYYVNIIGYIYDEASNVFKLEHLNWNNNIIYGTNWNFV